jgi:hypothetical protein
MTHLVDTRQFGPLACHVEVDPSLSRSFGVNSLIENVIRVRLSTSLHVLPSVQGSTKTHLSPKSSSARLERLENTMLEQSICNRALASAPGHLLPTHLELFDGDRFTQNMSPKFIAGNGDQLVPVVSTNRA